MSHPFRFLMVTVAVAALVVAGIYALRAGEPENEQAQVATDTPDPESNDQAVRQTIAQTEKAPEPASMEDRKVALSAAEAKAVAEFEKKVNDYKAMRDKLEGQLEPLDEESKPEEIEKHRADLRALIAKSRATATRGDLFTPEMESLIRRLLRNTVAREGEEIESTINDENPGKMPTVGVNDRYPDGIPVTTMPVQLLEALPKLPEYIEYRFLGKRLVLIDSGPGIVLDITPDVLT